MMVKTDMMSRLILGASVTFGVIYLMADFGLVLAFPMSAMVKAAGIILLAVFALRTRSFVLAVALIASAVGDVMLAWEPRQMVFGIAAFAVAHLAYIALFAQRLRADGVRGLIGYFLAAGVMIYGVAMLAWMRPGMGELQTAATVYNGIILVMAVLAVLSRAPVLAVTGALLFVASDSLIGAREFQNAFLWSGPVIWVTYFVAQLFLTLGLARRAAD